MKSIAVIIRVYSRIEDTKALLSIIKKYWLRHNYTIFVAHNGAKDGYVLDDIIYKQAELVEVKENSGHKTGAKDLVNAAYRHIKQCSTFDYILFIESDFWILNDQLIDDAIKSQADMSTSIWVEKIHSYAVDFFLVKKTFLDAHSEILDWKSSPEADMAKMCHKVGAKMYFFKNLRPIHAPTLLRKCLSPWLKPSHYDGGRFRLFPKAKALSHHVENLKHGMSTKKALANAMLGEQCFPAPTFTLSFFDKYIQRIARFVPHSGLFHRGK